MSAAPGSGQLPLALRYPPDQRFDTWVEMAPGAAAALRALVAGSESAPVLLVGPSGSGKTHLALATCAAAHAQGRTGTYVALDRVAGRLRDALDGLHGADVVALDGLQAVAGRRDDEIALFDLHNRLHDSGRALVYTARVAPDELGLVLPDLHSRLSQCTRFALAMLDDDGRARMLRLRADRRGLHFDDAAIDWLLRRVDRDPASLAALFDRLDRAALAAQRRITVPFLREVLEAEGQR